MRPGLVLVASAANSDAYSVFTGGGYLSRAASEQYLVDGMIRTLRRLRRWSKKTVVIGPGGHPVQRDRLPPHQQPRELWFPGFASAGLVI